MDNFPSFGIEHTHPISGSNPLRDFLRPVLNAI